MRTRALLPLLALALLVSLLSAAPASASSASTARTTRAAVSVGFGSAIYIKFNHRESLDIVSRYWPAGTAAAISLACAPLGGVGIAACGFVAWAATDALGTWWKNLIKQHSNMCLTEKIGYPLPWSWYHFEGWEWRYC